LSARAPESVVPYHPGIRAFRVASRRVVPVVVGLLPVGVAAAWIPVRADLPNTAAALLVVLAVGVASAAGGRAALLIGSLSGTAAFDVFDTSPYGQLLITRSRDVVTAIALLVAGLLVGELCIRLKMYRLIAARRAADFAVMSAAAGLMAFGEDADVVVRALAGELQSRLDLADCEFEYGPPSGARLCVSRDAQLVQLSEAAPVSSASEVDLPVWLGTSVVGRYRLTLSSSRPSRDRLLAAVGIAEQAGAALAGSHPDPLPRGGGSRRLRRVR
jgi:K+-sensing histidine kinase KdpD